MPTPAKRQVQADDTVQVNPSETSGPLVDAFLSQAPLFPAFLGVSIKNRMANRQSLQRIIPWVYKHSHTAMIVIGDYPHRHNLVALRGLSPHDALKKAMADGSRVFRTALDIVNTIEAEPGFTVCSAADLIETVDCRSILQTVARYFDRGGVFVRDVLQAVSDYANRAHPGSPKGHATRTLPILKDYMLEEIAMFLHIYRLGYSIEVYPGADMPIMRKIARAAYPTFPYTVPERTHVSIQVG